MAFTVFAENRLDATLLQMGLLGIADFDPVSDRVRTGGPGQLDSEKGGRGRGGGGEGGLICLDLGWI